MYEQNEVVRCISNPHNEEGFVIGREYIVKGLTFIGDDAVYGLEDKDGRMWYTANDMFELAYKMIVGNDWQKVKVGDEVLCIETTGAITKGMKYEVVSNGKMYIHVFDDDGSVGGYLHGRFARKHSPALENEVHDILHNGYELESMSVSAVAPPSDCACEKSLMEEVADMVNHPSHYTQGGIECIDAIKSAVVNKTGIEAVCTANVIKYLWRYETKNGLQDVEKAQWYLNRLIKELKEGE